jgi:hypothetical protein
MPDIEMLDPSICRTGPEAVLIQVKPEVIVTEVCRFLSHEKLLPDSAILTTLGLASSTRVEAETQRSGNRDSSLNSGSGGSGSTSQSTQEVSNKHRENDLIGMGRQFDPSHSARHSTSDRR